MPFHYLKTNQPAALIFYAPWAALTWLPHWTQINESQTFNEFPVAFLLDYFNPTGFVCVLLGMICITLQAYQFNLTINRAEILGRESQVHGVMYILLSSMVYPGGALSAQMVSVFLVIPALGKWWSLAEQRNVVSTCFDSGFLIALATLIYPPNAVLLLLAFSALMLFRTFNAREAMYLALGFGLPALFWFTLCFVLQWPFWQYNPQHVKFIWRTENHWMVWYIAAGVWIGLAILYYIRVTPLQVIRIRKMRSLMFIFLLLAVSVLGGYYLVVEALTFPFMAVLPMAVFISGFIHMPPRPRFAIILTYVVWLIFLYASCYGLINSY